MTNIIRYRFAKLIGKLGIKLVGLKGGMGKSFPGWLFLKFGSYDALNNLAQEPEIGSIIVTGTNGKTTTTMMLIKLLANDTDICYNFESNTINAIATGLLKNNAKIGVFEYGIRNFEHGIPEKIQKLLDPIGVVYTTISREHTQVLGVKNPFKRYFDAKSALCKNMKKGIVIVNSDDPRTAFIGKNKEKDIKVNYYGFDCDLDIEDFFNESPIQCPVCKKEIKYHKNFMNHRGIYECECGFKRPEPDVKITDLKIEPTQWNITIEGNVYNYCEKENVFFKFNTNLPPFGIHNLYNTLCSLTTYASFTPSPEKIETTAKKIFSSLTMNIVPPGRFEVIITPSGKNIGLGQGDNGDALKANILLMKQYLNDEVEFIYTTPDIGEEEIFEDHIESIKLIQPNHLVIVPGRTSIDAAETYYNQIKNEFNANFSPCENKEIEKRVISIEKLIKESKYKNIIITGCGDEQLIWEQLKSKIKNDFI